MNIFVGNLNFRSTEQTLQGLFEPYGEVTSVRIITDRETGRSRGFGFVEMANDEEARAAIAALDGQDFDGRPLNVNEARPREQRPARRDF
ncbi:MAG: RNA recognition motif domain-containing protein [Chloroflexota bacterium]